MRIKLKKIDPNATIPFKKHASDLCYDIVATKRKHIGLFQWEYETGIAMQIERGNETVEIGSSITDFWGDTIGRHKNFDINLNQSPLVLSIDIRPRSSIKDTGLVLCNSTGTIDEEYTGPIKFYFYHILPWKRPYKVGDKIGQMKIGFTVPVEFEVVDKLDATDRGDGGFGSTGK